LKTDCHGDDVREDRRLGEGCTEVLLDTSGVQEHALQAFGWVNNGNGLLGERPDREREGRNTNLFGSVALEKVEGVRGSDDSSIAERRRIYKWARVITVDLVSSADEFT
jgi:hypothetical protein